MKMSPKFILMVYFGSLIVSSNATKIYNVQFQEREPVNVMRARTDTYHPFKFSEDSSSSSTKKLLCSEEFPILCSNERKKFPLCVKHDKDVFNGLNTNDDKQAITFSQKDTFNYYFDVDDKYTCSLAQKQTDLTFEDFSKTKGILNQLEFKVLKEKLEDIKDNSFAICIISNSDQFRYFAYMHEDDNHAGHMLKIKSKNFHINNTPYYLSCYQRETDRTAKEVLEQSDEIHKKRFAQNNTRTNKAVYDEPEKTTSQVLVKTDEKWYENDKYQLGLILVFCIIVVTFSLCCCTTNHGDPDNEDPNNRYPGSSDLVLEVLDTGSSLSTASSTDSIPPSTRSTTDSTVAESTRSKSVETEAVTEHQTKSVELTKVIRTQSNAVKVKENTESQKESADLKKDTQPQSNSVELKEDTQSQTKSLVLEDAQSQSDALEKEITQSDTDSLFN